MANIFFKYCISHATSMVSHGLDTSSDFSGWQLRHPSFLAHNLYSRNIISPESPYPFPSSLLLSLLSSLGLPFHFYIYPVILSIEGNLTPFIKIFLDYPIFNDSFTLLVLRVVMNRIIDIFHPISLIV